MKKNALIGLALVALVATGCTGSGEERIENYEKIICPSGAPSLCFYQEAVKGHLETMSTPSLVAAQLQDDNYGIVVCDFTTGLSSLATNNGDYKLARILTGGNLYLVGIDKTERPQKGDSVVAFGEGLLPDLAFRYLYEDDLDWENDVEYVAATSDAGAVLQEGKHNGHDVDYVVIAQPTLYSILSGLSEEEASRRHVISVLREEWGQETGLAPVIPQAGLFINQTMFEEHRSYYLDEFFPLLDEAIECAIYDFAVVRDTLDSNWSTSEQAALFGFNSNVAQAVQTDQEAPNGFALVSAEDHEDLDLTSFLTQLGDETDYSDYIMF
ncbi:MAG: hypothetical protein LUD22_03665 [Coprobacillus sp.]|nr:hypothetical protein [Coprobacillus sp.]